jgi:hypothetical protein
MTRISRFALLAVVVVCALGLTTSAQNATCSFSYFVPPSPYNVAFQANGINHYGTIVGQASSTSVVKAFVRTSGGTSLFSVPGSSYTSFNKRNLAGTSVGFYLPSGSSKSKGLVRTSSGWEAVVYPGAISTIVTGINKYNTLVGAYATSSGGFQHGFRFNGGHFTKINFPGAVQTIPEAVNDNGTIVGMYWLGNLENSPHGFKLQNGTYTSFDVSGSGGTQPYDISNGGTIVIGPNLLYKNGTSKQVVAPGSFETFVYGINDLNQVTGVANYSAGNNTFTWKAFKASCQ